MKLKLPDVTLVCVETREHELARLAICDCLEKIEFGDLLILTDDPEKFIQPEVGNRDNWVGPHYGMSAHFHVVPDWPDKLGWSRAWWFDVVPHLQTSHTLNIQWDSWIWSVGMWHDDWLQYDFIGAPWKHLPPTGPRVGNGGFSLVSTRLKRYVYDRRHKFPCDSDIDDALLCIKYRPELEKAGFVWAPEKVAYDFSFEGCDGSEPTRHFGFHALFNFPHVLDRARLAERLELVMRSPNLTKPGSLPLTAFVQKHPALVQEFLSQPKELDNGEHFGIRAEVTS